MIQPCNFLAPNGEKSDLAQALIEQHGPDKALAIWDTVHSEMLKSDLRIDSKYLTEKNELHPQIATYIHNIATAREQWNTMRSDASLGETKVRKEYYRPSAEQLERNYEGARIIDTKDAYGRPYYKVIIPMPKFQTETADSLLEGTHTEAMKAPIDYITPEIPSKEITPKLDHTTSSGLAKGTENAFTQKSNHDMAQGDRAMVYIGGKPLIATYLGESTTIKGAHNFQVSNPYSREQIASQELGLSQDTLTPALASNSPQLHESLGRMFAQVRDDNGEHIPGKYFTSQQQSDAVDAVLTDVHGYVRNSLKNGDNLTANLLLSGLKMTRAKLQAFDNGLQDVIEGTSTDSFLWNDLSPEDAQARSMEIQNVIKSYDQIAGFALERMKAYGFNIKESIVGNITQYLRNTEVNAEDNAIDQMEDVDITGSEGRGLKDWTDSSFELDPRDTASKRFKFWLATIKDAEFGKEEPSKRVRMIFADPDVVKDIVNGTKVYTVRTPEQADRIKLGTDGKGSIVLDGKTFTVEEHKFLPDEEALSHWTDVFEQEKLIPEPGSIVYKLSKFTPKDNVLVNKKSALGFPRLAPFDQVFTDILGLLQESPELNYQSFQETLAKSGSPTMMRVAQEINNADQQLKNEFFKVMSKQYQRMRTVLFSIKQRGNEQVTQGSTISSNRFNEVDTLIAGWREQQKISPLINNKDGRLTVDSKVAQAHLEQFKKVTQFDWNKATPAASDKLASWTKDFLSDIGIEMTDEAINDFRINAPTLTKGTPFAGSWFKQYSTTADGKPNGVISALVLRLAGLAEPEGQLDESSNPEEEFLRNNNPLYTENTALRILAKSQAKFSGNLFAPMHKNAEGKSIYAYGLRTYESHTFDQLKNSEEYSNQYQDLPFSRNAWLLSRFNNADQRQKMELNYLDALKAAYRKGGGTTRPDMSPREQEFMAITMFQNRGNKYATFMDMTKSDKSTTPVIFGVEKEPVRSFKVTDRMAKNFSNVFQSEFDRIRHWEDNKESFNNKNYVAGGGLFYLMPEFNFEEMQKDLANGKLTKPEFESIWNHDGTIARTEDVVTRNQVVNRYTNEFIRKEALATRERWQRMGIFDDEQMKFDDSWTKKARSALGIGFEKDASGMNQYNQIRNGEKVPISRAQYHSLVASLAALEFSTHYFLHNTSMSQLISDDPAMAYKGKKGTPQLEQVETTMKEYQKRLAKDIAPGADPSWDRNSTYRSLTISDPNYKSYLGSVIPAYDSFDTAADAQELTTTQEHLDTMYAEGKIPDKTYHEMSAIVKQGLESPDKYYEFTKPEHKSIILQAMKPVQVGAQFGNGIREVHYIKTSSYPLLPELTRGQEIDALRQHMETQGIHRAVFKSGKKLGSPNEAANVFSEDGKFQPQSITPDAVQTLKREGFRIQQEVPYDEEKGKILTVSQMNKLITEGIGHMDGFTLPGHEDKYSGEDIRAIKEHIRTQMFDIQRHQYLGSVGAQPNADGSGYHFVDQNKMLKALEHEAIARNYPLNDLDAIRTRMSGGKLVMPLFLNGSADKFESLMMSLVKQIVTVKMPGKSFIQASSLGYKGHETFDNLSQEQKNSIIYVDGYDPKVGLRSLQQGDGVTKAAQVFVPFNFAGKDGKPMDISKFTKVTEDGRTIIDDEKLPPELRRFVGARIPNQEHSSMLPIEIVGFIPKQMGDLMIVPAEITQQMGSDFDVDKLYVYRPGYSYDAENSKFVPQGMTPHEEKGKSMSQLQQEYFDVHWSVLTHPDMFSRILNPLDKPELKNEKLLAEARQEDGMRNYYTASKQFDDFMSQKDAKVLVGATAVNNTFNAVIQDKNVRLGHTEMTEEGPREVEDFIDFADEKTGQTLRLNKLSGVGTSEYFAHESPSSNEKGTIRTKANNISSQLSEVVDHAKNRTIDYLNLNQHTFPASAAMTILETKDGRALNLKYNSRLIQQPIIVEYANRMQSGNDSLSTEFTANLKDKIFEDLLKEYRAKAGEAFNPDKPKLFSPQNLLKLLDTPLKDRDEAYYGDQYHALSLFRQLENIGTKMREIQARFNQDTGGAGRDLLSSLNTQADLPGTIRNGVILGVEEIGGSVDRKTGNLDATSETGHTFKNTVEVANSLYPELLPYQKLQPLFSSISAEMGRDKISTDNQRRVADAVRSNILASARNGLYESATKERARLLFDTDAGQSLARRIADAQSTWGKDDYFLARLATHIASRDELESTVTYNATGASNLDDFEITKAWAAMLTSPDATKREIGEDLIRYTYATGGIQTAQNFARFVPIGYLAGLPMAHELNHQVETLDRSATGPRGAALMQQVFQHNPDLALQLKGDFSQTMDRTKGDDKIPEFFHLEKDVTDTTLPASSLLLQVVGPDGTPTLRYPDYLSQRGANGWNLYKRINEFDGSTEYQRIDLLGKSDTLEYDPERGYARSIFPENRALYPLTPSAAMEMAHTPSDVVKDITIGTENAETFGITPEGSDYRDVVDNMLNHPDVSDGHKAILDALDELAISATNIVSNSPMPLVSATVGIDTRGSFKYGIDTGAYSYKVPQIELSLNRLKTPDETVRVMSHELVHYNTSLVLTGYDEYQKKGGEKPVWLTPEVHDSIKAIDSLRVLAQSEFEREASSDKELAYAFTTPHEFVAALFENKKLQKLLNDTPVAEGEPKSILQAIMDSVQNMFKALGEYMGISVKSGSMLDEVVQHSMVLMTAYDHPIERNPDSEGNPDATHTEGMAYFDEDATNEHSKEISDALTRLGNLRTKLQAKQTLPTDRKMNETEAREYQLRGAEINRLQYEIQRLAGESTLASLIGIGKRQMKAIDGMLTEPNLSTKQLENLLDTTDTWEHMIDDIYDSTVVGSVPEEAQVIRGQAAERKARIMNLVKLNEINDPTSVINSLEDFTASSMQTGAFKAYGVDLSRTGSMVAQRIDEYLKTASRGAKEEARRDRAQLSEGQAKVSAYAKKNGMTVDQVHDLMQQKNGKWGFVDVFSQDYSEFKKKTRGTLFNKLKAADSITDPLMRAEAVKDAYAKYRDTINKNVVYVDTSKMFDDKSGDLLDTPEAKAHKELLDKELGKDLADTMVEKAKDNFQDYLRDRYSYKSAIQVQVQSLLEAYEEAIEEKTDLTPDEKAERIEAYKKELTTQFNDEYNTWEGHHSPNVFFRSMRGEYKGFNPKFNNWNSIVDAPRANAESGKFYDKDFQRIQNDPELRGIYNDARAMMDKYKSYLPSHVTQEMDDNMLPIIRKDTKLGLNPKELKGALKQKITDAISMEDSMVEWARTDSGMVPIRYINPKGIEMEDRDRNIFRQLEKFGRMATHYKRAIEVQSGVELLHRIMVDKIQDTKGGMFDRINNGTKNLSDMVAYAKDKLLYEKSKTPEGELGNLYSLSPVKQFKLEKEIVALKDKMAQLDEDYAEGKIDPTDYMDKKNEITNQISSIPHSQILASKLGDVMIKLTELKTLSYNPFSAFANLSFGLVSVLIHANGRVDFDKKTAMSAFTTMLSATKRAVTGGLADGSQAQKILTLMEKYDMMGDLLDSDFAGQSRIHGEKTLAQKLASPYQLLRNSDYFMKGMILVALLKAHKVEGGEGKEVSLWDAYDSKGNWKGEPNKEWVSDNPDEETAFRKFQSRAIQVGKAIMGNQDHPSTMMIKKTVLGRLISQFRGTWLSEGINSRFEDERFDSQLGRQVKGRYRTYADLGVVGSISTLFKQGMSTFLSIDPFTGRKRNGEKFNDVDIENMRKNFAEAASYLTVMAAVLALRQQLNKDDENSPEAKRNKAYGQTLLNLVIRNRQDIEAYASPDMVNNLTSSLIPAMKVWVDFNRAAKGTVKYLGQDDESKNPMTGQQLTEKWMKTMPYTSLYGKFKTMWSKDADNFGQ